MKPLPAHVNQISTTLSESQVIEPVGAGCCKEQVAGSYWAHGGGFSGDFPAFYPVLFLEDPSIPQLIENIYRPWSSKGF